MCIFLPRGQAARPVYAPCKTTFERGEELTFFKVVLFQVVKRIMAPMSNEVITLVKDTSLANVIAVGELIMSAQNIVKVYAIIWPLFYTAIFYLIFCGVLTLLFNALEKKLNYYRG